ncbi:MAG TPA: dihydropteroate synthase [Legionellaceae bacterium]|nr:dihydropteroate synthase [Legionellaceae bacterium]
MNASAFIQWCETRSTAFTQAKDDMPLVMGILNRTPDSFYDGGHYYDQDKAYDHAHAMIAAGADVIDLGGESSRPGAQPISVQEELDRILPIMERIRASDPIALSIDTYKPQVMQAVIAAGAACINDIWALRAEGALEAVAKANIPVCLMHMQNDPLTMQTNPQYHNVMAEIDGFFSERIQACAAAGISRSRLILDPGFGFGKTAQHNLQIVHYLEKFQHHRLPILLGVSRKSTLSRVLEQPASGTLSGGLALATYAMLVGVSMIRTHDVMETKHAFKMIQEMRKATLL